MNNNSNYGTADEKEIQKFSKLSEDWWNEKGKFKPLHEFNPIRLKYIIREIKKHFKINPDQDLPFKNLSIIDIGCGGGLVTEPMARLGAKITGIDASIKNIEAAKLHAKKMNLNIDYSVNTPENINNNYDIVLCLEIIEHVSDAFLFIKSCEKILKKNGLIFFATINRTIKSFIYAIIGAEYILDWLPRGTHNWNKFIKPNELILLCNLVNLKLIESIGFEYSLISRKWKETNNLKINYLVCLKKIIR
jgi:2-polyprenyl-6-hydroxyphenyl methylase/3-demethylubiquinone-9 3-methyltransferase